MKVELTTVTIQNKTCYLYKNGVVNERKNYRFPIFYWGVGKESHALVESVVFYLNKQMPDAKFILAAYVCENWNDDFSPWAAPAAFGGEDFGGKADNTRRWLTEHLMPFVEKDASEIARFSVGYSLAGLFSLWVYCECAVFTGAVSCSGSLWYQGWIDYVQKRTKAVCRDKIQYIYLSLGSREEKTKNQLISTVRVNTEKVYTILCERQENVRGILEWNAGGHFSEPDFRIAKGINWILKHFVV